MVHQSPERLDLQSYPLVLKYLAAGIIKELPRSISGVLAPVGQASFGWQALDSNLTPATHSVTAARRRTLGVMGLGVAAGIGWKGCPAMFSVGADKSRCPDRNTAVLAVSLPAKIGGPPSSMALVADSAGASLWLRVRAVKTFLDPQGANSVVMFIYLGRFSHEWRVVGYQFTGWVE